MQRFLLSLFMITSLYACRKTKLAPVPEKKYEYYQNANLTRFTGFCMFTQAGEIINDSLVDAYVNQFAVHFYNSGHSFSDPQFQKFAWINEDSVLNASKAPFHFAVKKTTGEYNSYVTGSTVFMNDTSDIHFYLIKHKTFHSKMPGGNIEYFELELPYLLKKQQDSLFFPMSKYIIVSRKAYITSFRSDHFNNIFTPGGTSKLSASDTLLIQSFDLAMKRVEE